MNQYLKNVIFPYVERARARNELPSDSPALGIFDNFKGQTTDDILKQLEDNSIHVVRLPANCMDRLQPLDISVNKTVKEFLREKFNKWYSEKVADQLRAGGGIQPVAEMRSIGGQWLVQMFKYIQDNPQIIVNGFIKAGIPQAIDSFW